MVGIAHAATDNRDAVRDYREQFVRSSTGDCVRTRWQTGEDPCAPKQEVKEKAHRELAKEERTVYFDFNKSSLTPQASKKLNSLATAIKSDAQIKQARIVGYADRIGNPSYNERLSEKRAQTVRSYLVRQGVVTAKKTETRWFGETAPVTNCPDTLSRQELIGCLQKDRRVEVEIDYLSYGNAQPPR
jgi:OOP family OmpA-OmpF porin